MIATFIFAGIRRSEACWLTWDDVDFKNRRLYIREKCVEGKTWYPKTKRNRVVPMSKKLIEYLNLQHEQSRSSIWVFPSPEGKRWDPMNLTHGFKKIVRAVGLPWTLLDLRHTFGSHLAMRSVSLYKISAFMGNSPEICRKHYAALLPEELHNDVEF